MNDMPTGLIRRSGAYSVRRRIPKDLIPAFGGRQEIVRALGTNDRDEAKRRHALAWVELDNEFDALRPKAAATPPLPETPLSKISPTVISLVHLDTLRDDRDAAAAKGELPYFNRTCHDALRLLQGMLEGEVSPTDDLKVIEGKRNALRALLTGENAFAISAARKARKAIDVADAPDKLASSLSLNAIVDQWAAERQVNRRGVAAHRAVARWFTERSGDLPVSKIAKRDVVSFKDKLLAEGASPANINVKLSRLRTLLNYAVANDVITTNPAAGVKIADKQRAKDKRREFSRDELEALFGGPVHREGARPVGGGGEAAYWLPLLALYSGARQTELGQLHPDDVYEERYDDADGSERSAWVMRFVDNPTRGQKVKTEGSERRTPVHPDLIKLGFLEVVAAAKAERQERIFHSIKPAAQGELMDSWSKWFGRYRRTLGVSDKQTPFHSFRHSFKHYARDCLIEKAVNDAITGHESGDVADQYGALDYPLRPLVEAMGRYRVPGFVLPPPPVHLDDREGRKAGR